VISFLGAILSLGLAIYTFTHWELEKEEYYLLKFILIVALFVVGVIENNVFLVGLMLLDLTIHGIAYLHFFGPRNKTKVESSKVTNTYYCLHCGTGSDTNVGNCKRCGAPLSNNNN
jgi:hypothetical protein